VRRRWHVWQIDVSNAFLHRVLDEHTYMQQPPSFEDASCSSFLCVQAQQSNIWPQTVPTCVYSRLSDRHHHLWFVFLVVDTSLFVSNQGGVSMFMSVYVDDIVIASSSSVATANLLC
jgi:hypothetical protein